MILLKSKQYMLIGLTAVALTLTACGGDSAKNGATPDSGSNTGAAVDTDGDGVPNGADNCTTIANQNQSNLDGDEFGDVCDTDIDGDGVTNTSDNCQFAPNPNQEDTGPNGVPNGIGDACDNDDADGDGLQGSNDPCPIDPKKPM